MISITNLLVNYIPNNSIGQITLMTYMILVASSFKTYCYAESVFEDSPLSPIVWTNLAGFIVPLPIILNRGTLGENFLVNFFRGIVSVFNFILYWNKAINCLSIKSIIIGETACELIKTIVEFFLAGDRLIRLNLSIPIFYFGLKILKTLNAKEKEEEKEDGNPLLDYRPYLWITVPRLIMTVLDSIYSHGLMGKQEPIVDSFVTSSSSLIFGLGYYLYLKITTGYSEKKMKPSLSGLIAAYIKSENRIGNNVLTARMGIDNSLAADKFSFFVFHYIKSKYLDKNIETFGEGSVKYYLTDSLILILKGLIPTVLMGWEDNFLLEIWKKNLFFQILPILSLFAIWVAKEKLVHEIFYSIISKLTWLGRFFNIIGS